jgi:DNA-binding response OmpR family regulator
MANEIVLGNLALDPERFEVRIDGRPVGLTYLQFELLHQLAARAGRVVDQRQLAESLWQAAGSEAGRKLRIHISRLRKKIARSRPWRIQTVTRRGYALVNSETVERLDPVALVHAPGRLPAEGGS